MAEPAVTSGTDLGQAIRGALSGQKQATITVLSSLLAVQDVLGYVPEEAIAETAEYMGSTINEVWSVVSFYTNFRFTPPGEHTVEVCWGPTCHLLGAQRLLKSVQAELGIDHEGETEDGKFTLKLSTCLGACAHGPVVAMDHHHAGRATPDSVTDAIRKAR